MIMQRLGYVPWIEDLLVKLALSWKAGSGIESFTVIEEEFRRDLLYRNITISKNI